MKGRIFYIIAAFWRCFYLPVESLRFTNALWESLALVKWYAREHVLLCLVPAFFIARAPRWRFFWPGLR